MASLRYRIRRVSGGDYDQYFQLFIYDPRGKYELARTVPFKTKKSVLDRIESIRQHAADGVIEDQSDI